ncbi:MAG: DUF3459 domain-containing protein, partial [Ignavibacteria bacterium]|nr:DUF3459 domain-containing protein [Ignavibacteria bacterium]
TSRLRWELRGQGHHAVMLSFYAGLLTMRREIAALSRLHRDGLDVEGSEETRVVAMTRAHEHSRVLLLMNFSMRVMPVDVRLPRGTWRKILDSSDRKWSGPGTVLPEGFSESAEMQIGGHAMAVYQQESHNE